MFCFKKYFRIMKLLKKTQFPKILRRRVDDESHLKQLILHTINAIPRAIKRQLGLQVQEWRELLAEILYKKYKTNLIRKDWIVVVNFIEGEILNSKWAGELHEEIRQVANQNKEILQLAEKRIGVALNVNPDLPKQKFQNVLRERIISHLKITVKLSDDFKRAFVNSGVLQDIAERLADTHGSKIHESINRFLNTGDPKLLPDVVKIEVKQPFETYCPICKDFVEGSEYLYSEAFPDDYFAYWIANLVTHYRHFHIRYYDLSWRCWRYGDKNPEYQKMDHEEFKVVVNNRAKRQLIRAILKDDNLSDLGKKRLINAVTRLQNNDENTVKLASKALNKFSFVEESRV